MLANIPGTEAMWAKERKYVPFYRCEINEVQWDFEKEKLEGLYEELKLSSFFKNHIQDHYENCKPSVSMVRVHEDVGLRVLDFADLFQMFLEWARSAMCRTPFRRRCEDIKDRVLVYQGVVDTGVGFTMMIQPGNASRREISTAFPVDPPQWPTKELVDWRKKVKTKLKRMGEYALEFKDPKHVWLDTSPLSRYKLSPNLAFPFTEEESGHLSRLSVGLTRAVFPGDTYEGIVDPDGRTKSQQVAEVGADELAQSRLFFSVRLGVIVEVFQTFGVLVFGRDILKDVKFAASAEELRRLSQDRMYKIKDHEKSKKKTTGEETESVTVFSSEKIQMGRYFLNEGFFPSFECVSGLNPSDENWVLDLMDSGDNAFNERVKIRLAEEEAFRRGIEEESKGGVTASLAGSVTSSPSACSGSGNVDPVIQQKQKEIENFFREASETLEATEDEVRAVLVKSEVNEKEVDTIVVELKSKGMERKRIVKLANAQGVDVEPVFKSEAQEMWRKRKWEDTKVDVLTKKANQIRRKKLFMLYLLRAERLEELDDILERYRREGVFGSDFEGEGGPNVKRAKVRLIVIIFIYF